MRTNSAAGAVLFVVSLSLPTPAQVLSPAEIRDPMLRGLQEKYLRELKTIGTTITTHQFPYHFYLSRRVDISENAERSNDQRSIQFDRYQGQVVLKFTGNYFASYSAELMNENERARRTFFDVMLPILDVATPFFLNAGLPQAYAIEVSHHVRKRVLGVTDEETENLVIILQKASAERLMTARDENERRSAVLEGEAFLNASQILLWPEHDRILARTPKTGISSSGLAEAIPESWQPIAQRNNSGSGPLVAASVRNGGVLPLSGKIAAQPQSPVAQPIETTQDASPEALKSEDNAYRQSIERMVKELDSQAHFVTYAAPSFMSFRGGIYLQLPITTTLLESDCGSLYKTAALAFDRHVTHLIRAVLPYFKESTDFSGIDFSASVRVTSGKGEGNSAEGVEFIFMLAALRRYENYDITGQELINSGFVLVNGERISLDLQGAEAVLSASEASAAR